MEIQTQAATGSRVSFSTQKRTRTHTLTQTCPMRGSFLKGKINWINWQDTPNDKRTKRSSYVSIHLKSLVTIFQTFSPSSRKNIYFDPDWHPHLNPGNKGRFSCYQINIGVSNIFFHTVDFPLYFIVCRFWDNDLNFLMTVLLYSSCACLIKCYYPGW